MKNDDPALQMPILIKDVQSKIIMIREQNVIVDADVARLYGVETRWINEAVHNNPEKFPETYMFQLDAAETEYLRSKFYLKFPKIQTLSGKLSWSHYTEIIKANSDLEIGFYTKQCENENWSVRELKRQMKSLLFHRIALSKDKKGVLEISKQGVQTQKPEDIVKDPYILEFLGVNEEQKYLEGDIEEKVVANLQTFLLEFGKGFAFIGRQYKMQIGARQFKVDNGRKFCDRSNGILARKWIICVFQEQMVTSAMHYTHTGHKNYALRDRPEIIYIKGNRFKEIFNKKGGSHEKNHLDSFITSSRSLYGGRKENPRRLLFPRR